MASEVVVMIVDVGELVEVEHFVPVLARWEVQLGEGAATRVRYERVSPMLEQSQTLNKQ